MIFNRIKSAGIAQNSYFLGSGNTAVVIDPRRDIDIYTDIARQNGLRIEYVLETHRNEDFAVGSIELSHAAGVRIYHGPGLDWKYGETIEDGQEIKAGRLKFTALHTPGHTDESMSYAMTDTSTGKTPVMVFTGDTLFVGETGRIDLNGPEEAPRLASSLHDSLFKKLLPLGDGVIICPAHGGGSVCGRHIAERDESSIGIEKAQDRALQLKTKDEFVRIKLAEKLETPYYFRQMEKYNLEGPPLLNQLPWPAPLSPADFRKEMESGATVIDTSEEAAFGGLHIKGSYSIWLEGLPVFAGWVMPYDRPILLVIEDPSHLDRAVRYLVRAGYDRIAGYLKGGIESWYNEGLTVESLPLLSVHDLKDMLDRIEKPVVLDTRGQEEWESGHIEGAMHIYVGHLEKRLSEVPRDRTIATVCRTGHRAGLAASILLRTGYQNVHNVPGSMMAWKAAGYPISPD
jgi:hydroxyacylglutathione hydrolase